jgi:two-component system sensor histidine kinase PilS (NtrC family)
MRFSFLLLCTDVVVISGIVLLTGGGKSVFAFLYLAAILSTSILLSFNSSLIMATICSIFFLVVIFLEHSGFLASAFAFNENSLPMDNGDLWAHSTMKIFAFYLTAFLSGYLSRRIGLLQSFQQDILNSFSSGFISMNHDCDVTYLNAAGAHLLRRQRSKCIGQPVSSVFPTTEKKPNPLEETVKQQVEWRGKEITVIRGDGAEIPIGITVSPLKSSSKKHMGSIASFIDLTELKQMEEMLRRRDKLAAIGEMSASLAHAIRNPVASIRGAVQEMAENTEFEGTSAQLMGIVIKESDQLSRTISGFLSFVGNGKCEKEPSDVAAFLEDVVQTAKRCFVMNGNIDIVREWTDDVGSIQCDQSQIREAMLNLIQNGVEAMPGGGTLRVKAYRNGESPHHVFILVQDEGEGISPSAQGKIFDPFYTTKRNGTGLGMAIVHRIVTSHGGSIDVASEQGMGTTVTVGLPLEA